MNLTPVRYFCNSIFVAQNTCPRQYNKPAHKTRTRTYSALSERLISYDLPLLIGGFGIAEQSEAEKERANDRVNCKRTKAV